MKNKRITVAVAISQKDFDSNGPEFEDEFETISEAKKRAKYYLTEEYMNVIESTTRRCYSQVRVNGECLYDFFG